MLTEMDGLESRQGVFLMAASNRPGNKQINKNLDENELILS
jgi:AAA+ superfamily predicted ATPase